MKIYKSEIFGNIAYPGSFDELVKCIRTPLPDDENLVRMWRGQGNIEWPIHSTAYRRLIHDNTSVRERDVLWYENTLLKQASFKGFRVHEGRMLTDMELLAKLQHHGAATRLVDTSKNALIALWFAASSHPKKTGLLVGVHAHYLGGYEGYLEERPYEEVVKSLETYNHPQTWEPPVVTPRIAAQHSQFLYSDISNECTGSLKVPKGEARTLFIGISPTLKEKCLTILEQVFDIRRMTLFPDLEGFSFANSHEFDQWINNRW